MIAIRNVVQTMTVLMAWAFSSSGNVQYKARAKTPQSNTKPTRVVNGNCGAFGWPGRENLKLKIGPTSLEPLRARVLQSFRHMYM